MDVLALVRNNNYDILLALQNNESFKSLATSRARKQQSCCWCLLSWEPKEDKIREAAAKIIEDALNLKLKKPRSFRHVHPLGFSNVKAPIVDQVELFGAIRRAYCNQKSPSVGQPVVSIPPPVFSPRVFKAVVEEGHSISEEENFEDSTRSPTTRMQDDPIYPSLKALKFFGPNSFAEER